MTDRASTRPARWGRGILIALALLLVILVVAHWIWTTGARRRLDAQVAAYKAAGEPIEPGDFAAKGVADAENAVLDLRAAAAAIDRKAATWKTFDDLPENPALPLRPREIDVLRELVSGCPRVFPNVESAVTKPGVDWQIVYTTPVIVTLLPDLEEQRALANFLRADALLAHTDGDHARAIRRTTQILFIAKAVGAQPMLVPNLVSIGLGTMASELTIDIASDLRVAAEQPNAATPQQVRDLIAQLLDETGVDEAQRNGLLGERMALLDTARAFAGGNLTADAATKVSTGSSLTGMVLKPMALDDGSLMIRHMTAALRAAQSSPTWPEFVRAAPPFPIEVKQRSMRHLVAAIFMPSVERAVQTQYRARVDRRLAATVLALRLYAVERDGRFPNAPVQLVPQYLPALPLDAMATSPLPLKYIAGADPVVYSVGEDSIDDGGDEQASTSRPSPYPLHRWQRRDAVVHVNRQPRPDPVVFDDGVGGFSSNATTEPAMEPATGPAVP
jgi:hypothetical protein